VWCGRGSFEDAQLTLLAGRKENPDRDVFFAGDIDLLRSPCVSIVGTREATDEGWSRARRLARELVSNGVVVVSGLARGIDTAALSAAIEAGGKVVAVIGTPLDKASPVENADLQQEIYRNHLLISPFPIGQQVFPSNFPQRNRDMAALSDASVIVEANDTSGTLHQAAECQQLGRWLFILQSVVDNPKVTWPRRFLPGKRTAVIKQTSDVLAKIGRS
jgi:DNA processing protein